LSDLELKWRQWRQKAGLPAEHSDFEEYRQAYQERQTEKQQAPLNETIKEDTQSWSFLLLAMNPRRWEKAHQVGLAIAAGLGCLIGFLFGRIFVNSGRGAHRWYPTGYTYDGYIDFYWILVSGWILAGIIIGVGAVYMVRLLRT